MSESDPVRTYLFHLWGYYVLIRVAMSAQVSAHLWCKILTEHFPEYPHESTGIQKGKVNVVLEIPFYIVAYIMTGPRRWKVSPYMHKRFWVEAEVHISVCYLVEEFPEVVQ